MFYMKAEPFVPTVCLHRSVMAHNSAASYNILHNAVLYRMILLICFLRETNNVISK